MSEVSAIPHGHGTITPHLVIKGASEAIDFYKKAFGAIEIMRMPTPDGKLMHAEIQIGNSRVYVVDEAPAWRSLGPATLGGTPVVLSMHVEDVDAAFARAVEAGATVAMPLMDMFWGDRFGKLVDPFGHQWTMSQHIRDVSPEQMAIDGAKAMASMAECPDQSKG